MIGKNGLALCWLLLILALNTSIAQNDESLPPVDTDRLQQKIETLRTTELVMSMSQRSLVMPAYLIELKALIAKQAFNFWADGTGEPYVSHLNVYSALHQANKYLAYDSVRMLSYNQRLGHTRTVTSIVFGNDPNTYYSSSSDGTVLQWNLQDHKSLPITVYESEKIVRSLDISEDGRWMMVVFYNTGVALVSLEHGLNDILAVEDPEPVQTAIFIPREQQYLSVTKDGELKVKGFQMQTQAIGQTSQTVSSLEIDRRDGTIYAGTMEGILESWDDQSYFGYDIGTPAINCLDISPDGKLLAIGRERGDAVLWNLDQNRLERIISGHQSAITDIDFSPDNQLLLTTSRDKTARIWDLNDSRKLPTILDDHDDWVMTGCFDPSGAQVITGSRDEYVRTWPVDPKVLAERICMNLSRNMSIEEWQEFVGVDIEYDRTCKITN